MDPSGSRSRFVGLGGAGRLRCRPGATLRARFDGALRQKPQPDVRRLDLAVPWSCAHHPKLVDVVFASAGRRRHPPGGTQRRARSRGSIQKKRVLQVPEAGPSVRLAVSVERRAWDALRTNVGGSNYPGTLRRHFRVQVAPTAFEWVHASWDNAAGLKLPRPSRSWRRGEVDLSVAP